MFRFFQFSMYLTSKREKVLIFSFLSFLILGVSLEGVGFYGLSLLVQSKIGIVNSQIDIYFIRNDVQLGGLILLAICVRTIMSIWSLQNISKILVSTQSRFIGRYLELLVKCSGGQRQMAASDVSQSIETSSSHIFSALQSFVLIFGEIFSILAIICVAFYLAGINFLIAVCPIFLVVIIIAKLLKPRLAKSATVLSDEARNYIAQAMEASSLSQVIFGADRLKFLISRFIASRTRSGKAYSKVIFFQQLPRFILETSTISFIVIGFMLSSESLIASFTLVSPLLLRLLPSLVKISNLHFDVIKGEPYLAKIQKEMEIFNNYQFESDFQFIESSNLSLQASEIQPQIGDLFPNKPISFNIKSGQIIGIVGQSGSGKTSLIECIVRKRNYRGAIFVTGQNLSKNEYSFAYVPQNTTFINDSIISNVLLGLDIPDKDARAISALNLAGLEHFSNNLEELIDMTGNSGRRLSGGEMARLSFARALVVHPQIIILDELTAGLDEASENQILNTIQNLRENHIFIIVTHRKNVMDICDELLTIRK